MSKEAQDFLIQILSSGPQSTVRLYPWAEQRDINRKALSRAAAQLDLQRVPDPENGRYKIWFLPGTRDSDLGHETSTQDTNVGYEPRTLDNDSEHESMSQDNPECLEIYEIDPGHSGTVLEGVDTVIPEPGTVKTVTAESNTVIPVVTTVSTVADLDWTDRETVILAMKSLIDEEEFEVIDNFALAQDRSYTDVLNALLRHGIKRVISIKEMRRE